MRHITTSFIIAITVIFGSVNILAQSPPTASTGCVSGNCVNGYGKKVYDSGNSYEGNFVNGKFNGQGTMTSKYGGVYTGQFTNDVPNGKGKATYESGDTYVGDFVNGKFEGQGTLTLKDGSSYVGGHKNDKRNGYGKEYDKTKKLGREGTWKDDVFVGSTTAVTSPPKAETGCVSGNCVNGKGKMIYNYGDVYEGDWVNGKRQGNGKLTNDETTYIGQFSNDQYNGKGEYKSSDTLLIGGEEEYTGDWVNGKKEGQGTFTSLSSGEISYTYTGGFKNGEFNGNGKLEIPEVETYEGDFVNGSKEGQGTLTDDEGNYYVGEFKRDKKNGLGKESNSEKELIRQGTWKDDVFVSSTAAVDSPTSTSNQCVSGNCVNGKGKQVYSTGDTYEGDFSNGLRHGQGTYTAKNGDVYVGQFAKGGFNGKGRYRFSNGDIYEGDWINGEQQGKGKTAYSNGSTYEGEFDNGKRAGQGVLLFKTGGVYTGQFVNDLPNGKGKKTSSSGDTYEGDFVNDKFEGNGTYTFKNGSIYTGQFARDIANGKGKLIYSNGDTYEGDFVNSKLEGQGTFRYKDGSYYTGGFKGDKRNGYGKLYDSAGKIVSEGIWKDNLPANSTNANAASPPPASNNCVSGNCVDGSGKIVYANGDIYEGGFVNGKKGGQGTYTFKNGQVYVGQFNDNLRNGNGKFTFSDGSTYEGRFINDNFIGQGTYTQKSRSNSTGKFTVGQIVDLQSEYVKTYWGKAEIVEILGDKYKIRNLRNTSIEIVTGQRLRPFTPPDKYEIGQKVEVMDKGIWYAGEIIGNEVEYNDHYRIRFDGTNNRSDVSENVQFIRPLTSSSTAQTKQEYSSPLWVEKFGISEQILTKKLLTETDNLYEGCAAKYNTLVPPTRLETPSNRAFSTEGGSFGEENKLLLTYVIGNANLTRIKGIDLKTNRVGFTEPQLLIKRQETDEQGNKINLNVIPLVFKGTDSYQIEAEPKNDDYTGIIKFVCNAPKLSAAAAKLTVFNTTTNASSGINTTTGAVPNVPSSKNYLETARLEAEADTAYRRAISEYNRAMRSYDDAAAKLLKNKGATDLMPGTMARFQQEPVNAKKALDDLMAKHGAYLAEGRIAQVRGLIVKVENILR